MSEKDFLFKEHTVEVYKIYFKLRSFASYLTDFSVSMQQWSFVSSLWSWNLSVLTGEKLWQALTCVSSTAFFFSPSAACKSIWKEQ